MYYKHIQPFSLSLPRLSIGIILFITEIQTFMFTTRCSNNAAMAWWSFKSLWHPHCWALEDQRSVLKRVKWLYRSMKVKKADWKKENERGELQRAAGVLCVCRLQGDLSAALHRWCCETSSVGTAALLCAMATTSLPANPSGAHLFDSPSPSTHPRLLFLFVSLSKLASVTLLAVYLARWLFKLEFEWWISVVELILFSFRS